MTSGAQKVQHDTAEKLPEIGGFTVMGITCRTTNENGQAAEDINALWQRFFEEAVGEAIPDKDGSAIYAVYHGYEGDHTKPFSLTIGCRVLGAAKANPAPGLESVFVEKGDYRVFAATGEQPRALMETWGAIWAAQDLNRAFRTDVEIYGPRFFEEGLHEVLICVGVTSH